jgi:putative FmdB family regulatory protein
MPIYEYKCKKCGNEFEVTQRITEDPLTLCPEENCGGEIFRKISKNIGLVFNGSGFYLTDYVHKNGSSANTQHNAKHANHTETSAIKTDAAPKNGDTKKPSENKAAAKAEL